MTLSNLSNTVTHAGDGNATTFAWAFPILTTDDLVVTLIDEAGVETLQALTTNYTVTGIGVKTGGVVTMLVAPADGLTIRIERVVPLTQLTDLRNQGPFMPQTIEDQLDRVTMMIQQLNTKVQFLIGVGVGEIPKYTVGTRPSAASLPNTFILLRETGMPTQLQYSIENLTDGTYTWAGLATGLFT